MVGCFLGSLRFKNIPILVYVDIDEISGSMKGLIFSLGFMVFYLLIPPLMFRLFYSPSAEVLQFLDVDSCIAFACLCPWVWEFDINEPHVICLLIELLPGGIHLLIYAIMQCNCGGACFPNGLSTTCLN